MTDYKRMVSYMYQYENGIKKKNVGYVRVEIKNGQCKFTIHMQLLGQSDSIFPTYLIHRDDSGVDLIYLGDSILKMQLMDSRMIADEADIMGSGYSLDQMSGVLIFMNNNIFFATVWDDKALNADELLEAMKPRNKRNVRQTANDSSAAFEAKRPVSYKPEKTAALGVKTSVSYEPDETTAQGENSSAAYGPNESVPYGEKLSLEEELQIPSYKLPGGMKTIEMFRRSMAVAKAAEEANKKTAKAASEDNAKMTAEMAAEKADEGATKKTAEMVAEMADEGATKMTAEMAAEKADERATKETYEEAAKKAAEKLAEEAAKKAAKELAKETAEELAKENAEEVVSKAAEAAAVKNSYYKSTSSISSDNTADYKDSSMYIDNSLSNITADSKGEDITADKVISRTVSERRTVDTESNYNTVGAGAENKGTDISFINNTSGIKAENKNSEDEAAIINSLDMDRLMARFNRLYPFEDNEILLCVKIEPKDIGILPKELWPLSSNSFLLHGYYCYHHLILAKMKYRDKAVYILGVPGLYQHREQFMARMFGFDCFKSIKKREPKKGDFGYWYLQINC